MTNYFFDTSALVKRYHQESGSDIVDKIFDEPDKTITILNLTIVEILNTFYRLFREHWISEIELEKLTNIFYSDLYSSNIIVYSIFHEHIIKAERIIKKSVHYKTINKRPGAVDILIASAVLDFDIITLKFVSTDEDLNYILKIEKIPIINPTKPS